MIEFECVPLPHFLAPRPEINNKLCYFIQPYERTGFSVAIHFCDGQHAIKITDLNGTHLDIHKLPADMKSHFDNSIAKLLGMAKLLRIPHYQVFFVNDGASFAVVDVYHSGKFAGPGMIQDIFSKQFQTQRVIKVGQYNADVDKNMFIKPSLFSTIIDDGGQKPLYVKV